MRQKNFCAVSNGARHAAATASTRSTTAIDAARKQPSTTHPLQRFSCAFFFVNADSFDGGHRRRIISTRARRRIAYAACTTAAAAARLTLALRRCQAVVGRIDVALSKHTQCTVAHREPTASVVPVGRRESNICSRATCFPRTHTHCGTRGCCAQQQWFC